MLIIQANQTIWAKLFNFNLNLFSVHLIHPYHIYLVFSC